MMTPTDHQYQAEAFVGWFDGTNRPAWRAAFAEWAGADGKDFQPMDRRAIAARVERIMARPVDVLTDLDAFFRFAPPAA